MLNILRHVVIEVASARNGLILSENQLDKFSIAPMMEGMDGLSLGTLVLVCIARRTLRGGLRERHADPLIILRQRMSPAQNAVSGNEDLSAREPHAERSPISRNRRQVAVFRQFRRHFCYLGAPHSVTMSRIGPRKITFFGLVAFPAVTKLNDFKALPQTTNLGGWLKMPPAKSMQHICNIPA